MNEKSISEKGNEFAKQNIATEKAYDSTSTKITKRNKMLFRQEKAI